MEIETAGAIRLFFPSPSLTLVYFEALANALDANATKVGIKVSIQAFDEPDSLTITVTDNGDGFTEENFGRFKTLLKPRDKYHKGIGRLVFLNYFHQVDISSFIGGKLRSFVFKEGFDGRAPLIDVGDMRKNETSLLFKAFAKERVKSYEDLKPDALKPLVINQFLPTLEAFKRDGKDFEIKIELHTDESNSQKEFFPHEVTISPSDLPSLACVTITDDALDAFASIQMNYCVEKVDGKGSSLVAVNIDGRTIPVNLIPASSFPLGYRCVFLFESELFHSSADSSRQRLVLPEGLPEASLYRVLRKELGKALAASVPQITEINNKTKDSFAERFPHLLGYFDDEVVGLIDRDDALASAQQKFFRAQKEILQCDTLTDDAYEKSLELTSRVLTEYVLYRDKIIRRMAEMTAGNSEADIHELIVPRYRTFDQEALPSEIYQNNAWLLDDKFMSFRTVLSEARMDRVISAIRLDGESLGGSGRPDIAMIFSADPVDAAAVDVVVVEIKKKTDDEKENQYAVNQLLDRAVKLVEHCPNLQRIWYYAVIDISPAMSVRLIQQKWAPLFSSGKVFYQEFQTPRPDGNMVPTPMFVMSFDAIVHDAELRNHAFLHILRDGMKKYATVN